MLVFYVFIIMYGIIMQKYWKVLHWNDPDFPEMGYSCHNVCVLINPAPYNAFTRETRTYTDVREIIKMTLHKNKIFLSS